MKHDFGWLIKRLTLEANDAYMLGGRGRNSEGPVGFRRDTGLPDNMPVPDKDDFHKGVSSKHQGSISDPEAVRETVKRIAQAMLEAAKDPTKKKGLEDIFDRHVSLWEWLRSSMHELTRLSAEVESAEKSYATALDKYQRTGDDKSLNLIAARLEKRRAKKEEYVRIVESLSKQIQASKVLSFEKINSLLLNVRDELKRYRAKREADKEAAVGSPAAALIDYIKSFSEFYKNAAHLAVEAEKKQQVVLKSTDLPEKLKLIRSLIKLGPKPANKDKALELVDSAMSGTAIGDSMVGILKSAIEKFYNGTGSEADVVKVIFSLSPSNKMK